MQKSYLYWPYLKELETEIMHSFKEEDAYYVELERTLFYPHLAGGQPEDTGTIDGIRVLHVREKDGVIQHQVEEEMPAGPVTLSLNWERRYDHMQQHTAQHILSGLFAQMFSVQTVGFMIGEKHTTVDFDALGRHNAPELVDTVCRLANRLISAALPVHRSFDSTAANKDKGRGAPVRKIHIPTLPVTECGVTHVANTAEIGHIRIVKVQKDRGHLRVTYLAGGRCMREYEELIALVESWAERFNTSIRESFSRANSRLDEMDRIAKENKEYRKIAAERFRDELKAAARSYRGYRIIWRYIDTTLKPSDLVPKTDPDVVFLINRDGALYVKTKKPMQPMIRLMEEIKKDEQFKGGGSSSEWHGSFREGTQKEQAAYWWQRLEKLWT